MPNDNNKPPRSQVRLDGPLLVERLRAGDQEVWTIFVRRYTPYLRVAVKKSLNKKRMPLDRCDDIEQDVWQVARQEIEDNEFEYESEEKTHRWLGKIAYYCVLTLRNREKRHPQSLDEIEEKSGTENAMSSDSFFYKNRLYVASAEEVASIELRRAELRRELLPLLDQALRELSSRDREIVVRRLVNKEKSPELAERFGITTASVYQIVSRAKNTIRGYLRARGFLDSRREWEG